VENNIKKIWGIRRRILKTDQTEIDLLQLEKNSVCSWHTHKTKINRFILLKGDVRIKTSLGEHKLVINEAFDVEPPLAHEFIVKRNSTMIELAFVKEGKIDEEDICRMRQGGKFVKGKFYTLIELREKNWK